MFKKKWNPIPQILTFVGQGEITAIVDNFPTGSYNNRYIILSPEKFMQMDSKTLEFTTANGYYCSLSGSDKIYISRHRPCKNPTAICAKRTNHDIEYKDLLRSPFLERTESRFRLLEDVCAAALNTAESVLKVAFALEGKYGKEMLEDEEVKNILAQRNRLNKIIKERDNERGS